MRGQAFGIEPVARRARRHTAQPQAAGDQSQRPGAAATFDLLRGQPGQFRSDRRAQAAAAAHAGRPQHRDHEQDRARLQRRGARDVDAATDSPRDPRAAAGAAEALDAARRIQVEAEQSSKGVRTSRAELDKSHATTATARTLLYFRCRAPSSRPSRRGMMRCVLRRRDRDDAGTAPAERPRPARPLPPPQGVGRASSRRSSSRSAAGRGQGARRCFAQIGRIYEEPLDDPDRATGCFDSALTMIPYCTANPALFDYRFRRRSRTRPSDRRRARAEGDFVPRRRSHDSAAAPWQAHIVAATSSNPEGIRGFPRRRARMPARRRRGARRSGRADPQRSCPRSGTSTRPTRSSRRSAERDDAQLPLLARVHVGRAHRLGQGADGNLAAPGTCCSRQR